MNNKSRGSPSKFKRAEKIFAFLIIMVASMFIGKSVSYARTHGDYTYYPRTDGYYYIRVDSSNDTNSYGLYKVTVNIGGRASGTNSYYVDYSMSLISGTDQGISLRKNRFFTYCDLTPEDLILLDFDEVERQYYLPNWLDFDKTGYTLSAVSNAGTVQTYVKEVGTNYTYYIVDTNGTGITTWNPSHPGEWHDTIRLQYKPIQYKMTVRHWAYNLNTGQFDIDLGTQIEYADYDSVYTPPYSKTPTGYYNYSRDYNEGWKVTGDGTFNVYYYPNTYTINYNGNGATGGSIDPQTVNYGGEWTLKTGFTRTGHSLTGYAVVRASDNAIFCGSKGWQSDYGWEHPEEWTIYSAGSKWIMDNAWINSSKTTDTFTFYAQWKINSYLQQVYVRYQNSDGSWGSYSPVINKNYDHGSTVNWSRSADSAYAAASISYKVTSANTKYVSVYRNSYTQTINYYYNKASGTYNSPTHTKTLLGSKSWNQLYGTTFNAKSYKSAWGNVTGYHWRSIDSESWTVKGTASTNSYYSANKYRLNVDLNKGSGSSAPSGTSGNFDMEYGTYINLGTPTMTGYTFGGWSITEHNSTDHSLSANTFTMGYNKSYPNQSYTSDSTVKIKAKWNTNSYNLIYDLNDSTGSTRAQFGAYHPNTVKFDTEFTVSNPSRAGYTFAGWNITGMDNSTHYYGAHRTTERYIDNTSETVFRNLNSSDKAVVTFKAMWIPNTYTIHFDGNGAAAGNVDDITVRYDENMTLPANGYELDKNTFVGWTHDCTAHVGTYAEGQEILSSVIIDAAGMTTQNNGIINLYCAWDPAPNITVSDKTFSLDEARNGLITEERLFEGAYAMDEILDSEILPGTHMLENGSCNFFTITNFGEDEFTQFTDSGSATITYQVVDSVGNITEETITVFIVDNTPKEAQSGEGTYHVRFISDKYYDKTEVEGGLPEDSIWRKRPEYVELLSEVMEK